MGLGVRFAMRIWRAIGRLSIRIPPAPAVLRRTTLRAHSQRDVTTQRTRSLNPDVDGITAALGVDEASGVIAPLSRSAVAGPEPNGPDVSAIAQMKAPPLASRHRQRGGAVAANHDERFEPPPSARVLAELVRLRCAGVDQQDA